MIYKSLYIAKSYIIYVVKSILLGIDLILTVNIFIVEKYYKKSKLNVDETYSFVKVVLC